ncbi:MAG: hypothetical protein WDN31_00340 [Hyphomicrobium sp.]
MGLKSIIDGLYVDQLIQKNDNGSFVIYPHGMLGRGYLLPADREPQMRQRVRTMMLVSVIMSVTFAIVISRLADQQHAVSPLGWAINAGIGALLLAGIVLYQRRLAAGLRPAAGPRPSVGEWLRRGRRSRPAWTCWFSTILGAFMALLSALAIGVGIGGTDILVTVSGIIMLAVSVFAAWDGILGLKERRSA